MKKIFYILFLFSATIYGQTTTITVGSLKLNNQPATATGNAYQLVRNPTTKLVEQQLITGGGGGGIDHAKGNWNALNNIPVLVNGTGILGDYYTVTVAGTQFGYDFKINDRIEYNGSDWVKVIDNNLTNFLTPIQLHPYLGSRLNPLPEYNGFEVNKSINQAIGYRSINKDDVGNGAVSAFTAGGSGALFTNSTAMAHYGTSYFMPYFAGNGAILSSKKLLLGTTGGSDVEIYTGTTQSNATPKLIVKNNGQLEIPVAPTSNNAGTPLGILSDGKIVKIDFPVSAGTNITYTPSLRQINSSTGTGAILPIADGNVFGLSQNDFTTAERDKLAILPDGYFDGAYLSLTGVPATFAPSAHNHIIGDVTGLQTTLDFKQSQLNGTGFVKQSGLTTTYDNSTYLTGITSGNVTTALGFNPYNATNPNGYINSVPAQSFASLTGKPTTLGGYGITDAYPLTGNPSNFITSSALSPYLTSALASTTYQPIGSYLTSETDPLSLKKSSNLSDLTNVATSRTNLGLGTLATQNGNISNLVPYTGATQSLNLGIYPLQAISISFGASSSISDNILTSSNGSINNFPTSSGNLANSVDLASKQSTLVSGTNIKTVNGTSLLGSGNLAISITETDPTVKAINGIVKSNGTTISSAVANTDYALPNANTTGTASNITGVLPQGQVAGLTASLNNLVPYSGANQNLVMGLNDVSTNKIVISKTSNPFLQYISPGLSEWSSGLNSTSSDYVISASNGLTIPKLELSQNGNLKIYGNITATSLITGTTSISDNQLNSSVGANLFPTTSGRLANTNDLATKAGTQITEIFTANGTWTKPAGAKAVSITIIGGGGGAGSGRKGASATVRCAGGAGASAGVSKNVFDASDLTATVSITIGTAGIGGTSQATNSTNGNNGTAGGVSSFGQYLKATGGGFGAGGTLTTGSGGSAGAGLSFIGISGVSASTTGGAGASANSSSLYGQPSGATGGGITSANVDSAGGSGNVVPTFSNQTGLSSNAGAIGTNATNGATPSTREYGFGGGGGGSSLTANAGNGGNGSGYGAGGGSGGASVDAVGNSGAGGNGAPGVVIVKTYF